MMEFIVNYKIHIGNSIEQLSKYFAQLLVDKINNCKDHFDIALSGGSTPQNIFEYLATHHQNTIHWKKVKFYWGDERCVPPSDSKSNYKMAYDSFLSKLQIPSSNIFRIKGENNPKLEADSYSTVVLNHANCVNDYPRFDLIMLGIGEDGHTASIFPNQISLMNSDKIYSTAVHPGSGQTRITIAGKVINNASNIVFIAAGKSKSKVVGEIINQKGNYKDYPASFIKPLDGKLYCLLDEDSASQISRLNGMTQLL